jgi:hypothetical protein
MGQVKSTLLDLLVGNSIGLCCRSKLGSDNARERKARFGRSKEIVNGSLRVSLMGSCADLTIERESCVGGPRAGEGPRMLKRRWTHHSDRLL